MTPVPFTVVGGFLGAGKTTLLNRLVTQSANTRFAMLVNDFGRLEIDAKLIAARNSRTLSLTNGCMCCSIADGFSRALTGLLEQREKIDHIVVEASGVAQPQRIMDIAIVEPELVANGIVVMVDAASVRQHAVDEYVGDVVKEQLRSAQLHVVNKVDAVSSEALSGLRSWLCDLTGCIPAVECNFADLPLAFILGSESGEARGKAQTGTATTGMMADVADAASTFRTSSLTANVCPARSEFVAAADLLPASVIRGKGLVRFRESPGEVYLWQLVGASKTLTRVTIPCYEACQLVLIGTAQMPAVSELALAQLLAD